MKTIRIKASYVGKNIDTVYIEGKAQELTLFSGSYNYTTFVDGITVQVPDEVDHITVANQGGPCETFESFEI